MGRTAVAFFLVAGIACSENGAPRPDGSPDGSKLDVGTTLALVISVSGCAAYDAAGNCNPNAAAAPCCTGRPPLALSFAPLGSQELTRFQWEFGDGTATSAERAPTHTYAHPGRYEVNLKAGASGNSSTVSSETLNVVVEPLTEGLPCDVDVQCGDGLSCLCTPGSGCASAFRRGICSADCDSSACGDRRGLRRLRLHAGHRRRDRRVGAVSRVLPDERAVRAGLRLCDPAGGTDRGDRALDPRLSSHRRGARRGRFVSRRQRQALKSTVHDRAVRGRRRARRLQRRLRRRPSLSPGNGVRAAAGCPATLPGDVRRRRGLRARSATDL